MGLKFACELPAGLRDPNFMCKAAKLGCVTYRVWDKGGGLAGGQMWVKNI
jgi:hypothetical protein